MVWDVVSSDGFDHTSFESSSDPLFEENNVVSSMARSAERGECLKIDGGAVVPKDLAEKEGNVLKEASSAIGEKAENIKNDFLKSSQKENNAAAGIWKCGKVPSENLIDKRVIFVIKKCPNKVKNNTTEFVIKECIRNKKEVSNGLVDGNRCSETHSDRQEESNIQCIWKDSSSNIFQEGKGHYTNHKVLETLTKKVLPFFEAPRNSSCGMSKISVGALAKYLD